MFAITRKRIGLGLLLLVVALVALAVPEMAVGRPLLAPTAGASTMVCTEFPGDTTPTFDLQATTGRVSMPDGNSIFMWGYALDPGSYQMPGPVLCVNEGDIVTVNLTNNLPEPVSIVFPGQTGVTTSDGVPGLLTTEALPEGTVSYSFEASAPGTYLYESGTEPHKQVQMGLAGVLVVRPALNATFPGRFFGYNDEDTEYAPDREFLLVLQEIDPDLHQVVEAGLPFDVTTRHDRYWTINGRAAVDTLLPNFVPWLPSQPFSALIYVEADATLPALVRYANAGTVNHPYHPHGNTLQVIGRDGRPLGDAAFENFTTTIGAGQTNELLFRWDNVEDWDPPGSTPGPPENPAFPFPSLLNLVFKDDVTFYSGDVHLGEKDDLPTGTTSFNACGEYYFPWHSHALQEIQNFDEGFGGMLTLVRVDPPGGCP
jgi:FtsP/CotA-like multicopper oxidase with cupredoxin domain